ncbi:hypothetical protein ACHHV8_29185 [Paenibacillus sp. TAB 01]|uniref:hypothetical protein n=1 Tax=Paenibacillus sp. TAB 01 TaxID=3368988 RepID=UPI003752724F
MVRYKEISDRHREQLLAARGTIVVSRGNVHHLKGSFQVISRRTQREISLA